MFHRKRLSDADFVERLRMKASRRRRAGLLQAMFGLSLFLIMTGIFTLFLNRASDSPSPMMADRLSFAFGLILGAVLAGGVHQAIHVLVAGIIRLWVPDRTEQLLLQSWDELIAEEDPVKG